MAGVFSVAQLAAPPRSEAACVGATLQNYTSVGLQSEYTIPPG